MNSSPQEVFVKQGEMAVERWAVWIVMLYNSIVILQTK